MVRMLQITIDHLFSITTTCFITTFFVMLISQVKTRSIQRHEPKLNSLYRLSVTSSHLQNLRLKRFAQEGAWRDKMVHNETLELTWRIDRYPKQLNRDAVLNVVRQAFEIWSTQTSQPAFDTTSKLKFTKAPNTVSNADISIQWLDGDHGDQSNFDGVGYDGQNELAHTFYPDKNQGGQLEGDIHIDNGDLWTIDRSKDNKHHFLPYVLVHEIGHALGLGHSDWDLAVMNPIYREIPFDSLHLDIDDICAIHWTYFSPHELCFLPLLSIINKTETPNTEDHKDSATFIRYGKMSRRKIIEYALRRLKTSDIPLCTKHNALKHKLALYLHGKMRLNSGQANKYSELGCRFLKALRERLAEKESFMAADFDEMSSKSASLDNWRTFFDDNNKIDSDEYDAPTTDDDQTSRNLVDKFFRLLSTNL